MSVNDVVNREDRPAYVRFERRAIEDVQASVRDGRYVGKDVDFALVTPPYSKDCVEYKVSQWLENMDRNVRDERIPVKWSEMWKDAYKRWQNGQEVPLNGTPIRGWGLTSPAQQEMLIRMNCLTVEDLADINDEGMKRIGMGALDLKNKARNWVQSMKDHGPLAMQVTALEKENSGLKGQVETLSKQVSSLMAAIKTPQIAYSEAAPNDITASDLLDDSAVVMMNDVALGDEQPTLAELYTKKFGKPPHHRMKAETILAALGK